jgi:AcrR family transcriptional regulator
MTPRFTTSMDEKQKILDFCSEKFVSEGFYKTTVDEIAQEIHISKNTIYKYFPNKENLIWAAIENIIARVSTKITTVLDSDDNALEKLVKMLGILSSNIIRFTDKWLRDMQIHAPLLWEKVDSIRQKIMYKNISKIIRQGQKEKLFKDYPAELIITIFVSSLRGVVSPQFLLNVNFTNREALRYSLEILLNGILTEKGTSVFKTIKLPI